jgi:NitT/TauT family transport system substrate-binding protein
MPARELSALILLLPILWMGSAAIARAADIRVIYYPPWNISKLPLYLARDTGIFERDGLQLSWTDPGSNDKLLGVMKKGEADILVVSANHMVQNNATGGAPFIIVANTGYNYSVFLVPAAIKRPEDLKGQRIGSGEPGSTPDQLTRLALRKLGLDPDKDVTLVHSDEARSADRATALISGQISGSLVTAEAMYELEKTGRIKNFRVLADHKQLNIYAGGGADYMISATFLKNRRQEVKSFLSGICEGIGLAKKDKAKALEFVAKTARKSDRAGVEYLYRLYTTEVIPARPHPKMESVELAIQMVASTIPAARTMKAAELVDGSLVRELEQEGRCNF